MTARPRILLIDDEFFILDSLRDILSRQFDVTTSEKGIEAIDIFTSAPFPLIISDLMLPDISGLDVLTKVKSISPESQFIMFSGLGTIDLAVEAMKRGAFDFITKPFNSEHLIQLGLKAFKLYESLIENKKLKETKFIGEHQSTLADAEKSIIVKALKDAGGNKYKAAKILGIPRTSLYSKIKRFGLN